MTVYILEGKRTPQGSFLGNLSPLSAPELASFPIKDCLKSAEVSDVDQVYMGQVLQAGVGQAPARQAALKAGLPESVPCVTVNKVCGSGLQAIIDGARSIMVGDHDLVISGGMESMSNAPHLIDGYRSGKKLGNQTLKDSMVNDGLWDPYTNRHMGSCAEECVSKYDFSREQLDDFSIESFKRAQNAQAQNLFDSEISPVLIKSRKGEVEVSQDEGPAKANFEKMKTLRPVFDKEGAITAANASTLNDGAASLLLSSEKFKDKAKFKIVSWASHAQNPTWFTTAPVKAMEKNLEKSGLKVEDIDFFEINEAFAAVTMAAMKDLSIDHKKVNIYGGAVSLGHPIGCSGARLVVTLMNVLEKNNAKRGLASLCIGGGEALSIIIERI